MNNRIVLIIRTLIITLSVCLMLQGCGKEAEGQIATTADGTESVEVTMMATTEETINTTSETSVTEVPIIEENVTESTMAPIEETVILGAAEEEIATEATIPLEERPVVTTPVIQEIEGLSSEYESYIAMSGEEQQAFMQSFDSVEAFFNWHAAAKEEYESIYKDIEISGDEVIKFN